MEGDFKSSLAALLAKGNTLQKRPTIKETHHPIEEEKEKIKVDIFNDLDDEDKAAGVIDNVIL